MCRPQTPFQDDGDGGDGVLLEALDDLRGLVPIDAVDGTPLDHLGRAAQGVIQPELLLLLGCHPRQLLLHALQNPDGGQVGLQDYV